MSADAPKRPLARRAVTAVAVTLAALGVGFLLFRGMVQARGAARFTQCRNNLKQIELALNNYHDIHGCFPPAAVYGPDGRPWHSWRVLLVPYLEASPFWSRYKLDEPWDGPNNSRLRVEYDGYARQLTPVLHCPSDDSDPTHTSYLAVIGDGTMWPPDGTAKLDEAKDGAGAVIQVVEVSNSGVHWMEPVDLRLDAMSFPLNADGEAVRSRHTHTAFLAEGPPVANAGFADGSVKPLPADTPPDTLKSLLLRDDGGMLAIR